MKCLLTPLVAVGVVSGALAAQDAAGHPTRAPKLIPQPASIVSRAGAFPLTNPVHIVVRSTDKRSREIAELFADVIRSRTGFAVGVSTNGGSDGAIVLDTSVARGAERYRVAVAPSGVVISGRPEAGLLWGVQTFRQLLPAEFDAVAGARRSVWEIPAVEIRDSARFPWRGSMLDLGRHFFPVSTIERHIDVMSRYKLNVLHWHLTDDQGWRIEIKKYPRLTSVGAWRTEADGTRYGGFYTQKEIREVVEYARLRGVTVVPEIEMPGHSSAALASYPELGCTGEPIPVPTTWGVFSDIYCAGNERTFTFLTDVLTEVLDLFPSRYIHIGGDEVPKERWKQSAATQAVMRANNIADESALQSWFVARIGTWLEQHHRKLIGWDEVLQGGLMRGATVEAWEDTSFTRKAVEAGHDVIAAPDGFTYFNGSPGALTLEKVYSFEPVPKSLSSVAARHVLGGEGPLWSEHILSPVNLELMAYPRQLALAEVLWSTQPRDFAGFTERLAENEARLKFAGVAVGPADRDLARMSLEYDAAARSARVRIATGMPGVVVRESTNGLAPNATSPTVADSSVIACVGVHRLQPFYNGEPVLAEREVTVVSNTALGKPVRVTPAPSRQYQGTGAGTLTDGLAGSTDHADGLWQGWIGHDVEAVIDLQASTAIDTLSVTFLDNVRSWIMLPPRVEFAVSDDGSTWRAAGSVDSGIPPDREGAIIHAFTTATPPGTRARYVRMIGRYAGALPAWHPGAGRPSFLFADEIIVR